MYRKFFRTLSHAPVCHNFFTACPLVKSAARRFVPGQSWEEAREALARLIDQSMVVSVAYLGGVSADQAQADSLANRYIDLIDHVEEAGWAASAEVSVNPASVGMTLPDGERIAAGHIRRIAEQAKQAGLPVTIDQGGYTTTAKTLRLVKAVRDSYPDVGCVLQASLKRTETDCADLAAVKSRVRLCKGADDSPVAVAYTDRHEIDLSYVRCLKALMEGKGRPLVATHDPVMIEIAQELADHTNRRLTDYEFQMLYGIRPSEQRRLADLGHVVRVYVPFGPQWYDYFIRRLTEYPANALLLARALFPARHS